MPYFPTISPPPGATGLTRRNFLARSAALCAAAGWARAESTPSPWRMRLSTSSIHFKSLSLEATCERISALGYEAIDIWSPHARCPHLDEAKDQLGPERLQAILQRTRLQVAAWSVYSGGFPKYAEFIGAMGGGVAIRGSAERCEPREMPARMKAFVESLKPELELAEKHQVRLAIENHSGQLLHSPDSLKAFMDLADHPRLAVALAPYHLQVIQASVPDAIRTVAPRLAFFYAWQHETGLRQLPGIGPTDFRPWLEALAAVNYADFVNPFMHGEPEPDEMAEALKVARDTMRNSVPGAK